MRRRRRRGRGQLRRAAEGAVEPADEAVQAAAGRHGHRPVGQFFGPVVFLDQKLVVCFLKNMKNVFWDTVLKLKWTNTWSGGFVESPTLLWRPIPDKFLQTVS